MYADLDEVQAFFDNCFAMSEDGCNSTTQTKIISTIQGKAFPNPAKESLHILMLMEKEKIKSISLFNYTGQELLKESYFLSQESHSMSVAKISAGFYVLIIEIEHGALIQQKIIIQ